MAKTRKKSDLPTRICPVCGRPFAWRKKWEKVWDDVIYCSQRCRRGRPEASRSSASRSSASSSSVSKSDASKLRGALSD